MDTRNKNGRKVIECLVVQSVCMRGIRFVRNRNGPDDSPLVRLHSEARTSQKAHIETKAHIMHSVQGWSLDCNDT
jgi:hypothetical protein